MIETHARPKPRAGCLEKEQAEAAAEVWLQERIEASSFAQVQGTEGHRCVRRVCWSASATRLVYTAGRQQRGWSAAARLVGECWPAR